MKKVLFVLFALLACAPCRADELSELKEMMGSMQDQMGRMQERIDQLDQEKISRRTAGRAATEEKSGILSRLNPEISVMGDFIYHATDESGGELDNNFNFREVEIAVSASVDTYARADFFIAIENEDGETEVALEEGYLTLLQTPLENLQGKFGKFRPYFGKTNKMHTHALPWTTYPLVVQNFLGEEGFSEAGVSLNYFVPHPADIYSEITLEAFNNGGDVLGAGEEGEIVYLGHWKNFFDLNDDTSLEIGASHMFGENGGFASARTHVSGVDVTLNAHILGGLRTTSHTEALFSKREQPGDDDIDAWGMFTSLEQQVSPRWWTFGRYDFSQMPDDSNTQARAYSAGLTFAQSEYAFWRLMFTHTDNNMSEDTNEVWLQLNFGIGPHRPHQYR